MALDWLRNILGDTYTEGIDTKVAKEIGEKFVSKADFNTVNVEKKRLEGEVTTRDKQLDELKKVSGDVETFKQTIATLQADNIAAKTKYDAELAQERLGNAVDKALTAAGAKNNTAAKALLADFLKDAKLATDGSVKGLTAELETLAKGESTSFLFQTEAQSQKPGFQGMTPGSAGGNPPGGDAASYETRLAEARKSSNTAVAVAIKREAAESGVFLT